MKFPYEKAATILAECDFYEDKQVAKRWGIETRSIRNYRARLSEDQHLILLYQQKKQLLVSGWQQDTSKCLKIALEKLAELIIDKDSEPKRITAVANAVKIVGELKIASDVLGDD